MEWASISIIPALNVVLLTLLLAVAISIIIVRDLLASTILAGIFSLLMAAEYLVLAAPDVAITEAAVGAGVATLFFLCTLVFTGRKNRGPQQSIVLPLMVTTLTGVALASVITEMPVIGSPNSPSQTHVSPYYLTQSATDIDIPNVVTAILASYRGYDTFGETIVVFVAAMSVFLLLSGIRRVKCRRDSEGRRG